MTVRHRCFGLTPIGAASLLALGLAGCGGKDDTGESGSTSGGNTTPVQRRVETLFDLGSPSGGPFPSNRFTVADTNQNTGIRVNLPKPDCAVRRSECEDITLLNELDGFNRQPRIAIRFSGPINVGTVNSQTIFLVKLGSASTGQGASLSRIGINEAVWDPNANTLYVEPDQQLDQATRYSLIITNGVRDTVGDPVGGFAFATFNPTNDAALAAYRSQLLDAVSTAGVPRDQVVAASVFTTQTSTAILEKIRDRIKAASPPLADFMIGSGGTRAVFPLAEVSSIQFQRQTGAAPAFTSSSLTLASLGIVPGSVAEIAFGKFRSTLYMTPERFVPQVPTRTGTPAVQGDEEVYFTLFLPSGTPPAGGWPVAVYGHGLGDNKQGGSLSVASVMASRGFATIVINVVGHGGGAQGTLTVNRSSGGPVTLPAGGRGIDQDGDGTIGATEGVNAVAPRQTVRNRDGLRQTVADLMQLVRAIQGGVDVDGNGAADLNASRIYYFGQSFGGIYGVMFLAVEPSIRAGVPNVAGGSNPDILRFAPGFRSVLGQMLASRTPSLINLTGQTYNENMPLRNQAPLVNTVPGAIEIQNYIDVIEWLAQSGYSDGYVAHLRKTPLAGMTTKPIIFQFAKGDQTVPNPTNTLLIRAGELTDRTTYYRHDLAYAANPALPKNPHSFLTNVAGTTGTPSAASLAVQAQQQIAQFFASDGATIVDPDGAGPLFETPIAGPLPEELNFIP